MPAKTFEEWWKEKYGEPKPGIVTAQYAWHARDAEIAVLQAKLAQLEGIDQACDAANEHVLLLQADVDALQAKLAAARSVSLHEGGALMINQSESEFFQRQIQMEPSDDCRPDGSPLLCGAEWRADKADEFSETQCCILPQGHTPKLHVTRTGRNFR